MAYITKDNVKDYLGVNFVSGLDAFVDLAISQVTEYIERFCGDDRFGKRVFELPSPDDNVTRYFNGNGETRLFIGDLISFNSLVHDKVTLVENEDFYLYPLNASDMGEPYRWIELIQPETRLNANSRIVSASPYVFEVAQRNVEVSGKWRYSDAPPADIQLAALKLVGGVLKENIGDEDIREIKAESIGGEYQVTYESLKNIAHALKVDQLLAPYKRKDTQVHAGITKI